ncbi:MAG: hypothetical protein QM711_01065 [Micropruina sp.]|uniref:hypothetical protein n=1 Tax=Micropruina sp. TaxID=2737536 RepID=UPI0039E4CA49
MTEKIRRPDPNAGTRCTARAKATGQQCKHLVRGGGVCPQHGGKAPQVRRKREQRMAEAELLAAVREDLPVSVQASPAEMLLYAARSAHRVVTVLQGQEAGVPSDPARLDMLGGWLDRLSKAASVVIASKADELVIAQQARIVQGQAQQLAEVLNRVLAEIGLSAEQHAAVPAALGAALAALGLLPEGQAAPDAGAPSGSVRPSLSRARAEAVLS